MDLREFLTTVVTSEAGWFCLAHAQESWKEEWFGWPDDIERIIERVSQLGDYNVYFSPYIFSERSSKKEYVLPSRTIAADLDEANLLTVPIRPSVLVETSPERHQGYWVLRENADSNEQHEYLSKRLTYSIPRCDRSGWHLGKRLRVPGTSNYKYSSGPKLVRIVDSSGQRYAIEQFEMLPAAALSESVAETELDQNWIDEAESLEIGPEELLATLRSKLPSKVIATYTREIHSGEGRSGALWALMTSAFRAGASREQVYVLAKNSANNKFRDLRYGGQRELAKDVLRAEAEANSKTPDLRSKIRVARSQPGLQVDKRAYIAHLVREQMSHIGQFHHCSDGSLWFVRDDTGRPIPIIQRGEALYIFLDTMFGINSTEAEANYIISSLISFTSELAPIGVLASMSYYDTDSRTLLMHTGRRDVLKITKDGIENVVNGYQSVVFPWSVSTDILNPIYSALDQPWYELLLGDCFDNLTGLTKTEALALLRAWLILLVLRSSVVSRPILALFGQPGSGKSTLFRRLYALLYGRHKSLNAVSTSEDFDYATATDPLVVLDNVDTWERWLPDRLALAAASSALTKRKLYTNGEIVTIKRQAFLGLTAHNPQFGREDVVDRLLLLTFERLQKFKPESDIIDRICQLRNQLWGAILEDVQKVLASPFPAESEIPQFRVEDFARNGYWITKALGMEKDFSSAVHSLQREQKKFSLEEDHLLIEVLQSWLSVTKDPDSFRTPGQLWIQLEAMSKDPRAFQSRYKNAVNLGKKLWSLQDSLSYIFDVEWKNDAVRGSRAWRFCRKEPTGGRG